MKGSVLLVCALAVFGSAVAEYKSYEGYEVYRTAVLTDDSALLKLKPIFDRPEFDFWNIPRVGNTVDIMTPPSLAPILQWTLRRLGLEPQLLVENVETMIQNERAEIQALRAKEKREGRAPALDRFLDWDEIQAYIDEVAATYPSIVTLITIGQSYEGRDMRVVKISNGAGKSGIWFDAATHAREWIGPPTALHMINELTENLAANQAMLDRNDFYIFPVSNPDGYVFTWTTDRFWRKTRNIIDGSNCRGTDINRNFDHAWGQGGNGPCSETYPGTGPFSADEVAAMSNFLIANPQITFTVNIHSYGQYLLTPWGDTTQLPPDYNEMARVGQEAMDALEAVRGTTYQVGSTRNVLYAAYGLFEDWAYEALGVKYVYVIELPSGGTGFDPPPSAIGPVTTETWEAYKVFAANIPASRG